MENAGIKCYSCKANLTDNNWGKYNKKHNKKICKHCFYLKHLKYKNTPENISREKERKKINRLVLKLEMLLAYGNKCVFCNEDNPLFLTIDHINNNGYLDQNSSRTGSPFYTKLKKLGFPKEGLQILCYNCNCKKAFGSSKGQNIGIDPNNYTKQEYSISKETLDQLKEKALYILQKLNS